jgi:hypothetical protein
MGSWIRIRIEVKSLIRIWLHIKLKIQELWRLKNGAIAYGEPWTLTIEEWSSKKSC